MPTVDIMVCENKGIKENHLGLILGIKGIVPMNMGTIKTVGGVGQKSRKNI